MNDLKQIYDFAVKWCEKFKDDNVAESEFDNMSEDCFALGFKMDCSQAFGQIYGKAAYDLGALREIIDSVTDIPLLGSAVFSRWRYFNHWAFYGESITNPETRQWFIVALTRLSELAQTQNNTNEYTIVVLPEFIALKAEVEKLRTEISVLLLEKDELRFVICKNIESAYMLAVGYLECKAFEMNCGVLRLKRKIDIIQAKKNRREKIVLSVIEDTLDEEFIEFKRKLDEQIDRVNKAIEYNKGRILSEEETKEIKKLYRSIVKTLHPDLHPNVTPAKLRLFQNAVQAYEKGDLDTLRVIHDTASEPVIPDNNENAFSLLEKEKERLDKNLGLIREQIESIKKQYPYTMKNLVDDPKQIAEKKAELEKTINELKEIYGLYEKRIQEMLR